MMKRLYACLFILCSLVLAYISIIWRETNGQILVQFNSVVDSRLIENVESILDNDAEFALFSMKEQRMNNDEVLTYECAVYHPDALGIRMLSGSPLTPRHIKQDDGVVMLSKAAALEVHPGLDCIGRTVRIDGVDYRIIGIYETWSPLSVLTEVSEKSIVLPMSEDDSQQNLLLWVGTQNNSRSVHQRLQERLGELHASDDFMSLSIRDLSFESKAGRQGIWLFGWIELSFICYIQIKCRRRGGQIQTCRNSRILRWIVSGLLVLLCLLSGLFLARNLLLDARIFLTRFLDPGEWVELIQASILVTNTTPRISVFAALLDDYLSHLALLFGGMSIAALLLYISERRNLR